jgi:G3E family GTPase
MDALPGTDPDRIPVTLVTGFLGSGKTTLVNRILKAPSHARAAVVVSEYGEIGVDHVLIEAPRRRLRLIDGGCLCGHVHEEVAASLMHLLEHRDDHADARFDRIVIETSGLADPVPIIQILLADPVVTQSYVLARVVTVADGVHGIDHLDEYTESVKQAAVADVVVLSKADVADATRLTALAQRLAQLNPGALQVCAAHGDIDPALFDGTRYDADASSAAGWLGNARYSEETPAAGVDGRIRSYSLVHDGEITVPGLVMWLNLLAGFRGGGLLRVKGIVNVEGRPHAIQAVQTVISEPVELPAWPDDGDRRSHLVFITRGMDEAELRATFRAFDFEGGRERRNLTIRPETYERFKQSIAAFRQREAGSHGDRSRTAASVQT